jgi:glycosyltransferase involved in cell wall biosynthesis
MASGRPVLAYNGGGVRDTIAPGESGLLFDRQSSESLIEGVRALEAWLPSFDPSAAIRHASNFAPEKFDEGLMKVIDG